MTSCGKDVDAKVDKVDLARLLDENEIAEVYKKVQNYFSEKLSTIEVNSVMIQDDLIDQRTETSISGKTVIKGDEYAETHAELETKVKNNFYTYSTKTVSESKVAAFGDYYVSLNETTKDGQKDNLSQRYEYVSKNDKKIADAVASLPFSTTSLADTTIGVDKRDNIYAVYSSETINTEEGKDKDGKDATFIEKTTREVYVKCGNLKEPKAEAYKIVNLRQTNYDKELKIYKDYQTVSSSVISYKFEYKNRGKNDGKDKFINSLPEKYVSAASVTMNAYYQDGGAYTLTQTTDLMPSAFKGNYSDNLFAFKSNNVQFNNNYAYGFEAMYMEVSIDKSAKEIKSTVKEAKPGLYYPSEDMEAVSGSVSGVTKTLLRLKKGEVNNYHMVHFVFNPSNSDMTVYVI